MPSRLAIPGRYPGRGYADWGGRKSYFGPKTSKCRYGATTEIRPMSEVITSALPTWPLTAVVGFQFATVELLCADVLRAHMLSGASTWFYFLKRTCGLFRTALPGHATSSSASLATPSKSRTGCRESSRGPSFIESHSNPPPICLAQFRQIRTLTPCPLRDKWRAGKKKASLPAPVSNGNRNPSYRCQTYIIMSENPFFFPRSCNASSMSSSPWCKRLQ